jgi:heme/copper-type cytochrome/quinol oxidase subunit 2
MVCHEYCGAGHHTMAGEVTVVPAGEFEQAHDVTAAGRVVPADGAGTGSGAADVAADATSTDGVDTDDEGSADANEVN